MEFQDGFPNYEQLAQHNNDEGVGVRKRLMTVFWLLLVVTLIELAIGFVWPAIHKAGISKTWLIIVFVAFTVLKAGYIVMSFMHLGDENKWMRWTILGPYCMFVVYLIYMLTVQEALYSGMEGHRNLIDPVNMTHSGGGSHHEGGSEGSAEGHEGGAEEHH